MLERKPDVIVFSSHKTGTQSITTSLNASGCRAAHCHLLENYSLSPDQLLQYLKTSQDERGKRVKIISVFRLPIERHISSFFQFYGSRILQSLPTFRPEDTVIAKASMEALNALLISDLSTKRLAGYKESLHQLLPILGVTPAEISQSAQVDAGELPILTYAHPLVDIHLLRFPDIFRDFPLLLQTTLGIPIANPQSANVSKDKWYATKYKELKLSLRLPRSLVEETYNYRQDLIELFYPHQFTNLLSSDYQKYTNHDSSIQATMKDDSPD